LHIEGRRPLAVCLAGVIAVASLAMSGGPLPSFASREGGMARRACELSASERAWLRKALDAWTDVSTRVLTLPLERRAPIILFDATCEYHLHPDSAVVSGRLHGGHVDLPNGQHLAPHALAFASLATGDTAPFLVVALRSVWESDTALMDDNWDEFLTRSFVHEMTHTRQLPLLVARLRAAGGLVGMNDVDDDIVQETFDTSAVFRASVNRETTLLYAAALARTSADRKRLAREALTAMKERREKFFGGEAAPWSFVEQLMLDLEGAAAFAELAYLHMRIPRLTLHRLVDRVRGDRGFWSQDEGLALYLLLSEMRPGWAGETFTADPRSAMDLIDESASGSPKPGP
jgi:hypothetical protein